MGNKLQSILFYFYNFGQLLTILCKLQSICTNFQPIFANFSYLLQTFNQFFTLQLVFKEQYEMVGEKLVTKKVSVFDQKWVKTFFFIPCRKRTLEEIWDVWLQIRNYEWHICSSLTDCFSSLFIFFTLLAVTLGPDFVI